MEATGGRAIFLVGPSSAGKSSLGRALLEALPEPWMFFETDRCGLRGPTKRPEFSTAERQKVTTRGAAFAMRGYLDAGIDLVVELGLWNASARVMAATVFAPYEAWLVGLRWELPELQRRELRRSDGIFPGTALAQASDRDAWLLPYDLVVDSVVSTPRQAAGQIVDWLATKPAPRGIRAIAGTARRGV